MAQSEDLVKTLKIELKQHGLTYADVASALSLSEASVKRMFADKHFSLKRLDTICQLMGMEITDLVFRYEENRSTISHLSYEQEKELVSDMKLLLIAVAARNHCTFDEIIGRYEISQTECIQYLARLDRLGIVELLPNNRIKLIISEDFRWLENGPIEAFYMDKLQSEYFDCHFNQSGELRLFLTGAISSTTQDILYKKLDMLAREFATMLRQDLSVPLTERTNTGVVLAIRNWEFSAFYNMRRETEKT